MPLIARLFRWLFRRRAVTYEYPMEWQEQPRAGTRIYDGF